MISLRKSALTVAAAATLALSFVATGHAQDAAAPAADAGAGAAVSTPAASADTGTTAAVPMTHKTTMHHTAKKNHQDNDAQEIRAPQSGCAGDDRKLDDVDLDGYDRSPGFGSVSFAT